MKSLRVLTDVAFPGVRGLAALTTRSVLLHSQDSRVPCPRAILARHLEQFLPIPPSCVKMAENETLTFGFCIASWVELSACSSVECSFR